MYLNILKKSSARISKMIENYFSFYLSQYKECEEREKLLDTLFSKLFGPEKEDEGSQVFREPYEDKIS